MQTFQTIKDKRLTLHIKDYINFFEISLHIDIVKSISDIKSIN